MPRTAVFVALTLMLLTGIVLGQLHGLVSPGSATVPAANPMALQTAADFYEAVNAVVETGDPAHLRAVAHPGYNDHSQPQGAGTLDDLEASLLALREAFPGLRFVTSDNVVHDNLIVSRLTTTGSTSGTVNGIAFAIPVPAPDFDLLRIENDRVSERWASSTLPIPPRINSAVYPDGIDKNAVGRTLRLERVSLARHTQYGVDIHAGTMILGESGSASVQYSPRTATEEAVSAYSGLLVAGLVTTEGEAVSIPAGTAYRVAPTGLGPASVLVVTIANNQDHTLTFSGSMQNTPEEGVTRELLAFEAHLRPTRGPFELTVHQIQLEPGSSITAHRIEEAELLFVRDGSIEAVVGERAVSLVTEQGTLSRRSGSLVLGPEQGITGNTETEVAYRATGQSPANILLVTLSPVAQTR